MLSLVICPDRLIHQHLHHPPPLSRLSARNTSNHNNNNIFVPPLPPLLAVLAQCVVECWSYACYHRGEAVKMSWGCVGSPRWMLLWTSSYCPHPQCSWPRNVTIVIAVKGNGGVGVSVSVTAIETTPFTATALPCPSSLFYVMIFTQSPCSPLLLLWSLLPSLPQTRHACGCVNCHPFLHNVLPLLLLLLLLLLCIPIQLSLINLIPLPQPPPPLLSLPVPLPLPP